MEQPSEVNPFRIFSLKHLPAKIVFSRLLFTALLTYMLVISTLCLVHGLRWIDKPFAGFLFFEFPAVGSLGNPEWPGIRAGMHYRDVILEANGQRVYTGKDIWRIVDQTPVGQKVRYLVARSGEKVTVSVPVSEFTLNDIVKVFFIPFLAGMVLLAIGVIVYVLKPDSHTTWVFFLGQFLFAGYSITGFEMQSESSRTLSLYVTIISMLSISFLPAQGFHLSLLFPEKSALVQKKPALLFIPYLISLALACFFAWCILSLTGGTPDPEETIAISSQMRTGVIYARLYSLLAVMAILASCGHAYWQSKSTLARQRARVVLWGSAVAFVPPTVVTVLVSATRLSIPFNFLSPLVMLFPATIGFAIARHNLFDVDVYLKRAVGYVLMTGIVATGYFALQTVVKTAILDPLFGETAEQVYPILFALLTVFAFNPISRTVQQAVDKLFYRKGYDYKATVASVSDSLTSLSDIQAFLAKVIQTLRRDMFLDHAGVILLDNRKQECQAIFHGDNPDEGLVPLKAPCLSYDDPLLTLLARDKKLITKYDIAEEPSYAGVREACGQKFAELRASMALPLFSGNEFSGALVLGYKKSGHFYSREDIDLVRTLGSMTSTAIEQDREKGQRATLMKLFTKHVSPEVAESLWEQREQFLDGGRPRSQKLLATVLFTDLQGFTAVSEQMDPQVLMDWLNTYMESIANAVMEHGGVVDDYFGDGVKVNFGVPVPRASEAEVQQDAVNAVKCALALEREMVRLNVLMKERGLPTLRMRVGIFTGPVVAGSLGSADRMKYTTLGDTVNTASRLESFDKDLVLPHLTTSPCRILIGGSTLRYLGNQFATEQVGEIALKGKEIKVKAYCVLGTNNEAARTDVSEHGTFSSGTSG